MRDHDEATSAPPAGPEVVTTLSLNVPPAPVVVAVLRYPDGRVLARLGNETHGRILTGEQLLGFRAMLGDALSAMLFAEHRRAG